MCIYLGEITGGEHGETTFAVMLMVNRCLSRGNFRKRDRFGSTLLHGRCMAIHICILKVRSRILYYLMYIDIQKHFVVGIQACKYCVNLLLVHTV